MKVICVINPKICFVALEKSCAGSPGFEALEFRSSLWLERDQSASQGGKRCGENCSENRMTMVFVIRNLMINP